MAIFTVTNLNDSDVGSLRQAIIDANNTEGADEIVFSVVSGTITLTTGELLITDSLTIQGTGITVSGNNSSRVFNIDDGTDEVQQVATIVGLTITQGVADYGGGISNQENTTITNSTITQNVSGPDETILGTGGGINNRGILNLVNSTVSGNSAFTGGGIDNYLGQISIINSTISGNTATNTGGGIHNYSGQISIINSTISGNTATNTGGGIYNGGYYSTAEILNATISNNSAALGGGLYNNYKDPSSLIITNTIIANSSGGDFFNNGTFTSNNNLVEDGSDPNAISDDPNLSPLQNNGGSTLTHALLEGSIAINAGSNANIPSGITTDQRGLERIIEVTVDIGAYESSSVVPPPPPPPPPPSIDAAQYGASYRDLITTFGYDLPALTNHYLTHGMAEGRSLDNFDEFRYVASSYVSGGDLINAFGLNGAAATEHYIRYGYAEPRSLTAFSPSRYILSYPDDLLGAFGTNTLAATQHFITTGFFPPESRNPSLFPSDRYIASYGDLINTYHYNLEAGSNHYLIHGQGEGRQITFDPVVYLMKNLDVAADPFYGASLERATEHYIVYGYADGHLAM